MLKGVSIAKSVSRTTGALLVSGRVVRRVVRTASRVWRMQFGLFVRNAFAYQDVEEDYSLTLWCIAFACLIWYCIVASVCTIGCIQIWRFYSDVPKEANCGNRAPHIDVIRPIKGVEPFLYDCLAAIFQSLYPKDKLHVRFCVSSREEPCMPTLERIVQEYPDHDVTIYVEDEDPHLIYQAVSFGPNPKIRNMSRAYREAIGDIIWILDCNVWVSKVALGRMLANLEGYGGRMKNKFVHQLPIVVETGNNSSKKTRERLQDFMGGRLEETFMSSSHAKFYTAINTVLLAPCTVGKSTMFRRSHLDSLTNGRGIDHFAHNICEDHLIGDLLWKGFVPDEKAGKSIGKHALCFGDFAVQPIIDMSLQEYWDRRVRWLRVRKFTVALATFVEPGTECLLCSAYGAFAMTTLPFFANAFGISMTWHAFFLLWSLSVSVWCLCDRALYCKLQSGSSFPNDVLAPDFVNGVAGRRSIRPFGPWVFAWFGREILALPIWLWAVFGGTMVEWRGRKFIVGIDMKVQEIQAST